MGFRPRPKYADLLDRVSNDTGYTLSQFMDAVLANAIEPENMKPADKKVLEELEHLSELSEKKCILIS